ncbi:MAG: cation-translocating P-type ATPase [Chloroflexota bacterium]|nr:cation-translocating P-type ATPase [Chloroflexota bacterium]
MPARDEASLAVGTEKKGRREEGHEGGEKRYEGPWWRFPPLRNALASGALLVLAFILSRVAAVPDWVSIALYVAAIPLGASHWGREAVEAVFRRRVNIDVLMAVATVGAAVLGLWEEAAFLAFLYGAAEGLEEYAYDRTRSAIRALLKLAPAEAHVLRDGVETLVPAAEMEVGDLFLVRPGESLATDGVIRRGSTSINEAPVTGESMPVSKEPGAQVFAGAINLTGAIEVEATRRFQDNTLSRIIHLVEEAQEEKTNAQRFIDKFGSRYSPAILLGALALLVVPTLFGGDFRLWATRAITLAVAGAPCALVMSTPVAVAAAIGRAGKRGVLIKGGLYLERLGSLTTVAFDKTGTLTKGRPEVTDVVPLNGASPQDVVGAAAAVERLSEHPLAQAIVRKAGKERVVVPAAEGFQALTGAGASAQVDGHRSYVGSPALFQKLGADMAEALPAVARLQEQGKTVVLVGDERTVTGAIAIRDEVRPEAREAIESLRRSGIRRVVMLTGDNERTARAIASQLGVDDVRAGLKPDDKVRVVKEMEGRKERVAMVGDGINDAPALASASVGIAMGAAGTDAAIEAADVALMGDDLRAVAYAIQVGRRAQGISRQNIVFSVGLLAVLIPLSVVGSIGVAVAVIVHEGSELLAVANGLRAAISPRSA